MMPRHKGKSKDSTQSREGERKQVVAVDAVAYLKKREAANLMAKRHVDEH